MRKYHKKLKSVFGAVPGYLLLLFASGVLLQACIRDEGPDPVNGDDASVLLTLRMPQLSLPETPLTRAQTAEEMHISNLRILVFLLNGSGYQFSYQVTGIEVSPPEDQQTFQVQLNSTTTPMKIIVVANAEAAFASYIMPGTPESEVRKQLQMPFTADGLSGDLPMYGEATLPGGLEANENTIIQITALRAIARVDVVKNLDIGSDNFELDEVYVFRANDKVQLIPDSDNVSTTPRVSAPSIAADAAFLNRFLAKSASGGAEAIEQIYIPESVGAQSSAGRRNGTTAIVVGGRYNGSDTVTYYRADFDPDGSGNDFGQVLRNHHYVFNITKVTAPGWDTPENAASNFATSMLMNIQVWEDFVSNIYFWGNRFGISSRSIDLRFVKDREKRLDVESTHGYSIQWLNADGTPEGDTASQPNETISNTNFDVTIVNDTVDSAGVTHLLFRTLNNNHGGEVKEDKLRISVEDWYVDIDVRQDNTAIYSNRHFSVLSSIHNAWYFNAGQLGTTSELPVNDNFYYFGGLAMRMILNERFAPGDVIGIGGFAFDQVNDSNTHFNVTSTTGTNYEAMERIIRIQDVIYLSYNTRISTQMAALVLAWLRADPRRVLILGMDSSDTNANVRSQLTGIGTWAFAINAGDFTIAGVSDGTDDFLNGPFGAVTAGVTVTRADDIAGYIANPPASVTRLVNHTNGMVFGVDRANRIIYHGDANLFLNPQLSNEDGNVTSDLDRLMANTWAWVVEQLIYGDD